MSDIILGIDLGTTNSAVGTVDSGFPILLANGEGKRITPSAVWIGRDGTVEVGAKALRRRTLEPDRVVTSIKRLMGRRADEVEEHFPVPVESGNDGLPRVLGKSPEEISAEILRELKRIAEWRMGAEITKAVITVPAYFHDAQRATTKRAGELAGLEVVRILNEPTAAALAYGLDKLGDHSRVAVYDLGGGTFDLSILEMQDGVFQVLATHGDTRLGGDDLDALILRRVEERAGLGETTGSLRVRFMEEAERVKLALSEHEEAVFRIPFHDGANSIEQNFTRAELEAIAAPWIQRTLRHCRQALADAALKPEDLDAVVLVGGSTRIPMVRRLAAEIFQRDPDTSQHPDESVALGAVIQGGMLSGALQRLTLLDVTPLSLGLETFGGLMNVILPRNTTIPAKAGEMFTNAVALQPSMLIRVLQGEREMARDNWELGQFQINFEPGPRGSARVGVQFSIDADGILSVLARDTKTNTDTVLAIQSAAINVDDARVEAMISDSVDHAWADMHERQWTEASLKADELLTALDAALPAAGDALSDSDRAAINSAADAVRTARSTSDLNALKAANAALDAATESLAAIIVERAMDAAFERRGLL